MNKNALAIAAWFFAAHSLQQVFTVGPFPSQQDCESYREMVEKRIGKSQTFPCWDSEKPRMPFAPSGTAPIAPHRSD